MKFRTRIWKITRDRLALVVPKEYQRDFEQFPENTIYEVDVKALQPAQPISHAKAEGGN
ncbi:hypothetical protein [Candidatus Pyrohabitans sp.]